jgi:aspartate/glutamate racemase
VVVFCRFLQGQAARNEIFFGLLMKTMGMIGGIGPESTIDYYRSIVTLYRERRGDGSYPLLIINSIDLQKLLDLIGSQHLKDVTDAASLSKGQPHFLD